MSNDRRSGRERRTSNRSVVGFDVEWEGPAGRQIGTMSDVSLDGCFILGSGEIEDGETVKIFVPLADGMKVQFTGRVANHVFEIGFGVKFDQLSGPQQDLLTQIAKKGETS